jgi:hypothetical protein
MRLLYTTLPRAGTAARGKALFTPAKERRFALYLLRE